MSGMMGGNIFLFNKYFLRFRKKYYFNEAMDLLTRHKLLVVFIICLIAPEMQNIAIIGIPFYKIIDPTASMVSKLIFLMIVLFFLVSITKAQSKLITGGVFREYLSTLSLSLMVLKKIDIIILLYSLNFYWLAILFGAAEIYQLTTNPIYLISYYALYFSMILSFIMLLINILYKNIFGVIILILALILITIISKNDLWFLNLVASFFVSILSFIVFFKMQTYEHIFLKKDILLIN